MKVHYLLLTFLALLIGCVGTVQDAKQSYSRVNDAPSTPLQFPGILNAVAISDTRIEVFFYPASGGSGKYTYDIIVGNSPFPISLPSDILKPDYKGMLKHTLSGLDRLSTYVIKVEVRDRDSEVQSNSQLTKTVTTFDNEVADFSGISSASNTPGQDGKDSIKVRWTPARSSGGLTKQDWDPKSYEIILVDAEKLTPSDMDVTSYGPADGRYVYGINHDNNINEYIVRGLPTQTKFYVRMRAIHEASVNDVYNPKKRSELNTNYVTIATLSDSLADLDFQPESFAVALAPGEQGLNAVTTSWLTAKGVFDHYRLYYSEAGGGVALGSFPDICLSPLLSPPGETIYCKRVDFRSVGTPITGLKPYTAYEIALVLCADTDCTPSHRIVAPFRTITTDPTTPNFNGVKAIVTARNLDELGSLFLSYDAPSFATGYFDGLVLKMRRTVDGSDAEVEITENTIPVYHSNYNFLTETEVAVRGVDYLALEPYCFTLYPFKWESNGLAKREFPNDIWKCVNPKPEAATTAQFPGLTGGYAERNAVTLFWDQPKAGVFTHYELFWRKQSGANFNWGDAIAQAGNNFDYTNYGRMLITSDKTNVILDGFANGEYSFGIITFFTYVTADGAVVLRSETNVGIKKCTIDDTSPDQINCI